MADSTKPKSPSARLVRKRNKWRIVRTSASHYRFLARDFGAPNRSVGPRFFLADLAFFSSLSFHAAHKAPANTSSLAAANRPITVRPQREQPNLLFWPFFSYRKLMSEETEAAIGALACPALKGRCVAILGASCMVGAQSLPLRERSKATRRSYPTVALVQTQ